MAARIAAIGITNQRETVILWERSTGRCVGNAIVWQDRRTSAACVAMKQAGLEPLIRDRTGLVLDPYFSGTKVRWMLDQSPGPGVGGGGRGDRLRDGGQLLDLAAVRRRGPRH